MDTPSAAAKRSTATPRHASPRIVSFGERPSAEALAAAGKQGFDHALLNAALSIGAEAVDPWDSGSLTPLLRLRIDRFRIDHPLVARFPEFFAIRREARDEAVLDPRKPAPAHGHARARLRKADLPGEIAAEIRSSLCDLLKTGARGFVFDDLDARATAFYARLSEQLRAEAPDALLVAATPGLARGDAVTLADAGFDFFLSSLGWWDMKARWLVEEYSQLSPLCPMLAEVTHAAASRATDPQSARTLLAAAAFTGAGLIVPHELAARVDDAPALLDVATKAGAMRGAMEMLTSAGSDVLGLIRYDTPAARDAAEAMLFVANTSSGPTSIPARLLAGRNLQAPAPIGFAGETLTPLAPREARILRAIPAAPVSSKPRGSKKAACAAAEAPRIVVENLSPSVAGGDFPVKRVVGEHVRVTADVYTDGHEKVGAELRWRAETDKTWKSVPMLEEGNDVWAASFTPERMGRHEFTVEAWDDRFGYLREGIAKKVEAGVAQPVDFMEGRALVHEALEKADSQHKKILKEALARLDAAGDDHARADALTDPALAEAMEALDPRHHSVTHKPQRLDAERIEARFSSWYEIFPRSMTDDKQRHGTFRDVIDHLPRIAAMGFDTLYFPPIHPIGKTNRKGPNNTLTPEPGDPGSPYAIGSEEGGHDAIHPELGSFEDFRALVAAAKEHGLEIALDFAIQCAPDHPWLKEHPGWFDWRPDGSIKYAENPPKKYQDIVNVDFYEKDAVPDLWIALRDVVLLWVKEGVKTFRVDNPHTKPLPFWEWMIREVRQAHPEVIFLSEAFTRPKVMYRLAKIGFSQSYTYFTWRDSKAELAEYIEELTGTAPKDFFRPHFFVNTPDINPVFLQTGGRAGHRIHAVLAATLSGLWGVYSGFELCDATPLPGREEYLDSEKYEIRPREWRAPGDIVDDITLLNRLRRGHPALQTHLNTRFYPAYNDNIIYYGKSAPDGGDMILVAVNMDPHNAHGCDFELPLWEFGLPDDGALAAEDLVSGERFRWQGKVQHLHLTPDEPYRIWRIERERGHG